MVHTAFIQTLYPAVIYKPVINNKSALSVKNGVILAIVCPANEEL